jgi:hypothetical protein
MRFQSIILLFLQKNQSAPGFAHAQFIVGACLSIPRRGVTNISNQAGFSAWSF